MIRATAQHRGCNQRNSVVERRIRMIIGLSRSSTHRPRCGRFRVDLLLPRSAASVVHAASSHPPRPQTFLLGSRGAFARSGHLAGRFSRGGPLPSRRGGRLAALLAGGPGRPGPGQLHVWWRHTSELGWRTPAWLRAVLRPLWIVLPEDHDGHHRNPDIEFGDIFRFYDVPARVLIAKLSRTSRRVRNAGRRASERAPAAALRGLRRAI